MKVTAFTFIRDAVRLDYPVVEAINSVLPLCDEFVVAVGACEDGTRALIEAIPTDKIRIVDTVWNDSLREGGRVLAVETDKAMDAITGQPDWCFYIQADEVLHEQYLEEIRAAMLRYKDDARVEGLLLRYQHFYGSYDYVADSRRWYRQEVRIVRHDPQIRSWKDAQGFRKNGKKLQVKAIDAMMYHYGWVRHPQYQQLKRRHFERYWHNDGWIQENLPDVTEFDYSEIDTLVRFAGTHPHAMQPRVNRMNWQFTFDPTQRKLAWKERLSRTFEQVTGHRIGEYKNYDLLK